MKWKRIIDAEKAWQRRAEIIGRHIFGNFPSSMVYKTLRSQETLIINDIKIEYKKIKNKWYVDESSFARALNAQERKILSVYPEARLNRIIYRYGITKLMKEEKKRLGYPENRLVFIGTNDTASYWYCAQKSLYKQIDMEQEFFASYLTDRILYSIRLGYVKDVPRDERELLGAGDNLTMNDIERILADYPADLLEQRKKDKEKTNKLLSMAKSAFRNSPIAFGKFAEKALSEVYPTVRWNFRYNDYVVLGVPDGITNNFVYEFKTANNLETMRRIVDAQADLYGYFFRRPEKRIQIYLKREDKIITTQEPVKIDNALTTLQKATYVYEGGNPFPPKEWKCRYCEYLSRCPITPLKRNASR
ncbi:MAG: hypothetical protein QXX17_00050 [Conexivisphaerales archaeon]